MAIEVRIHREFDDFKLDVQFQSESRRIGILGASGCGKSLTLKSIAGIERPETGKIESAGKVFFDSAKKIWMPPQERNVGYLFQNYALFPTITVEKNIGIALRCGKKEKEKKVRDMIDRFSLQGLEKKLPGQLSGGQQQRILLARALVNRPRLLILDEPSSGMDEKSTEHFYRLLKHINQKDNVTILMVTHDRKRLEPFADDIWLLEEGTMELVKTRERQEENRDGDI